MSLRLQILFRLRIVLPDCSNLGASVFFLTVAASGISFGYGTLTDLAQSAAEYGLGAVHAASFAVDVLRQDGCMIQF